MITSRKKWWQLTNVTPLQAMLMAMRTLWTNVHGIAPGSLWTSPLGKYLIRNAPATSRIAGRRNDGTIHHFAGHFNDRGDALVRYRAHCPMEEVRASLEANECCPQVSAHSNNSNWTRIRRWFWFFHSRHVGKGLGVKGWPLIPIGVSHIKLIRNGWLKQYNNMLGVLI